MTRERQYANRAERFISCSPELVWWNQDLRGGTLNDTPLTFRAIYFIYHDKQLPAFFMIE